MSANLTPNSSQDKEVDLSQVSKSIGLFFDRIAIKIFHFILFLKRNLIILVVLFILGAVLGYLKDKNNKIYESEIVVKP
ncbi:MAG: putative membrane protein, partial [Flavobacterium sp.]